jgi:protein SCO1
MRPGRLSSRHVLLLGVAVFGLAAIFAYRSWKASEQRGVRTLPVLQELSEFSLVDQDGHRVGLHDLRGKLWVADFCARNRPGDSERLAGRFAELDNNFKKSSKLRLLSVATDVDPSELSSLKDYRARFEASGRWLFLTGTKPEVATFVQDLLAGAAPKQGDPASFLPTQFVLVDGKGKVRGYYDGLSDEVVPQLLTALGSLLRAGEK